MALITATEAKNWLPGLTGSGSDTLIETLIAAVDAAFARWCGYPPASAGAAPTLEDVTYTRYLTGTGGRWLVLDVWPALSITSIEDDPTLTWDGSTYLVASTDYTLLEGRKVLLKETSAHGLWSSSDAALKVVSVAGYSTIPGDLKVLVEMAVRNWWDSRTTQGKASIVQGGTNTSLRDEEFLTAAVRRGLGPYRLPRAFL